MSRRKIPLKKLFQHYQDNFLKMLKKKSIGIFYE